MEWRRLPPGAPDPERTLGMLVFPALLAASVIRLLLLPPGVLPGCRFRGWTGVPCPACGSSRAFYALLLGRPFVALRLQPLVVLASGAFAAYAAYAWVVVLGRLPRLRGLPRIGLRRALLLAVALILLNWAYLVAHDARHSGGYAPATERGGQGPATAVPQAPRYGWGLSR